MDYNSVPINDVLPEFSFPKFELCELNDKITVAKYKDNSQMLCGFSIIFSQGSETDKIEGLSYFAAQLMKRGTNKRSSSKIAEEFDRLGANFSASVSRDFLGFNLVSLKDNISPSLEIMIDCLFNSTFPENEITQYKIKHIADIEQEMSEPSFLASVELNKLLYPNHPYSNQIYGTKKSISLITKEDCIRKSQMIFQSKQISVIVSGNFDSRIINKYLKTIENNINDTISQKRIKSIIPSLTKNRLLITHKNIQQSVVKIGKHTIKRNHRDFPSLQFTNTLFGGFFMSRLNELLREKHGYTYGIHSQIRAMRNASVLYISGSLKKKYSFDAVMKIIETMHDLSKNKISEQEFNLVKRYFLGSFVRSLETTAQVSTLIRNILIQKLKPDFYDSFYNSIRKMTIEQVFKAQSKYLSPDSLNLSIVGNKKNLFSQFAKADSFDIVE